MRRNLAEWRMAQAAVLPLNGRFDSLLWSQGGMGLGCTEFVRKSLRTIRTGRIVMVVDGAGWQKSGQFPFPSNHRLWLLPPDAPALNLVKPLWDELRAFIPSPPDLGL